MEPQAAEQIEGLAEELAAADMLAAAVQSCRLAAAVQSCMQAANNHPAVAANNHPAAYPQGDDQGASYHRQQSQ